jgi:hypothetical protein
MELSSDNESTGARNIHADVVHTMNARRLSR